MTTENKKPVPPRIIDATHYRDSTLMGPIEIIGSTKHGTTTLLAVADDSTLQDGDKVKTKSFVLNAREFIVKALHTKPMKIAGVWYEVRPVPPPAKPTPAKSAQSKSSPLKSASAKSAPSRKPAPKKSSSF
jgi:hypothetical protein